MEHFYENITGWFNFPQFYKYIVTRFPSESHFVEVGCYEGKSLAYLIVEIINAEKNITVTAVDSFIGVPFLDNKGLLDKFHANLKPVQNKFNVLIGNSWEIATKFEDNSLDFVFIDACHEYEPLKKDILAWMSKIKAGGILAGHDYTEGYVTVRQAVDEIFGDKLNRNYLNENCWLINM